MLEPNVRLVCGDIWEDSEVSSLSFMEDAISRRIHSLRFGRGTPYTPMTSTRAAVRLARPAPQYRLLKKKKMVIRKRVETELV